MDAETKVGTLVRHSSSVSLSLLGSIWDLDWWSQVSSLDHFWTFPLNPWGSSCFSVIANLAIPNLPDLGNVAMVLLCPAVQKAESLKPFLFSEMAGLALCFSLVPICKLRVGLNLSLHRYLPVFRKSSDSKWYNCSCKEYRSTLAFLHATSYSNDGP